jgi:hypothetical protein
MKLLYFSVNVSSGSKEHVGIMAVNELFPNELTQKVKTACDEHFDAEVEVPELDINNYLEGRSGEVVIKIDIQDDELCEDKISICQTWVY